MFKIQVQHSLTNGSPDEGGWVPNVAQTFLLDEVCHRRREVLVVSLHIVLQNQTTERTRRLICEVKKRQVLTNGDRLEV